MRFGALSVSVAAVLAAGCNEQRTFGDDGGGGGAGGSGGTVVADGGTGGAGGGGTTTRACPELGDLECARRADCVWTGLRCIEPPPACGTLRTPGECGDARCHWWTGGCHEGEDPSRCDQPDPGSCEAAGCEWAADRGCGIEGSEALPCGRLGPDACARDRRCRVVEEQVCAQEAEKRASEEDGGGGAGGGDESSGAQGAPIDDCDVVQTCEDVEGACFELDARGCAGRGDCAWVDAQDADVPECECGGAPGEDEGSDGSDGSGAEGAPCDCAGFRAPAAGCQPREQVDCEPLDLGACRDEPLCAQVVVDHCEGARRPPCGDGDEGCGDADEAGSCDEIVCAPGAEVCPQLDADACGSTVECTSLFDAEANYLGCWFNDECRDLDVGRCEAHPSCGWDDGDGADPCDCGGGGHGNEGPPGDGEDADRDCICDAPEATCEHL